MQVSKNPITENTSITVDQSDLTLIRKCLGNQLFYLISILRKKQCDKDYAPQLEQEAERLNNMLRSLGHSGLDNLDEMLRRIR